MSGKITIKKCPCGGLANWYDSRAIYCQQCPFGVEDYFMEPVDLAKVWNELYRPSENSPAELSAVAKIYLEEIFIQSYEAQIMYPDDNNCGEEYSAMREIMGAYYTDEQVEALEIKSGQ